MSEILIMLSPKDGSDIEAATVRQLIDLELERCPTCSQVYADSEHLPFHCQFCYQLRDERWLRQLYSRARSLLSTGYFGAPHD